MKPLEHEGLSLCRITIPYYIYCIGLCALVVYYLLDIGLGYLYWFTGCRWLLSVSGLSVELSPFARPLPVGYSRNSWHKGRQYGINTKERCGYWTGVLRAAFRILSPIWVFPQNSRPIPWLMTPHLTASPSCKELSIPERAVDKKKLHTKETGNIKECLTTLGWTISFDNKFHLNRSRRNTNRQKRL